MTSGKYNATLSYYGLDDLDKAKDFEGIKCKIKHSHCLVEEFSGAQSTELMSK